MGPRSFGLKADQQVKLDAGSRRMIYILGPAGTPQPIEVVTGESDGRFTAVESERLKPGMKILTGLQAPAP